MSILFTSDLHLGHENILTSRSQFKDIEEHDQYLIIQWNKKIKKNDDVYILGDLSFRASQDMSYYLTQMKGRKHLIVGNHDKDWMKRLEKLDKYFETVDIFKTIKFEKKRITLCHYPMLEWPGSRHVETESSYLIHGHIHNLKNSTIYEYIKSNLPHALHASVDINNFQPVTFEELKENCAIWYGR